MKVIFLEPVKHYSNTKSKKKHHHVPLARDVGDTITAEGKNAEKKSQQDCKSNDVFQENNENKSSNYMDVIAKGNDSGSDGSQIQCIRFSVFQQQQWHILLDHNHQEL